MKININQKISTLFFTLLCYFNVCAVYANSLSTDLSKNLDILKKGSEVKLNRAATFLSRSSSRIEEDELASVNISLILGDTNRRDTNRILRTTFRHVQKRDPRLIGHGAYRRQDLKSPFVLPQLKSPILNIPPDNPIASADQNYIISYINKDAANSTIEQIVAASANANKVNTSISYIDGLGRAVQNIQVFGSPSQKDIISPVIYDALGREEIKYLPYSDAGTAGSYRTNSISAQSSFYAIPPAGVSIISHPFGRTRFETNPLSRIIEQGAAGLDWQPITNSDAGHTTKTEFDANVFEEVRMWTVNSNGNGATAAFYLPNTLYKAKTRDENWKPTHGKAGITEEFTDFEGRVVLKRIWESDIKSLSTYYIYDGLGNLRYVLPPAVNENSDRSAPVTSFTEQDDAFNQFIYAHRYDNKNRVVEKKTPGKGWISIVYNALNQEVLSQDANQAIQKQWIFTKYDMLGHVIMTGQLTKLTNGTRQEMQAEVNTESDGVSSDHPLWETRTEGSDYTNLAFPRSYDHLLSTNYYDDYDFPGNTFGQPIAGQASGINVKGLTTGSKIRNLATGDMPVLVNYYDDKARVVQTKSQNHLNGTDVIDKTYNFQGELLELKRVHQVGSATTTIKMRYGYDHLGRKTKTWQTVYGSPQTSGNEVLLSELTYNEIGQVIKKNIHREGSGAATATNIILNASNIVQNGEQSDVVASNSVTLAPGFHAQLGSNFRASIASTFLYSTDYVYNERGWLTTSTGDKFSMELKYNDGSQPQFNGNISNQIFANGATNSFSYSYDNLNRLTSGAATGMSEEMGYDVMGNINTLKRDNLTYTYSYQGNQLNSISKLNQVYNYAQYDDNGNSLFDGRIGVNFTYNFLNLPSTASKTGLSVNYTYDATGGKLRKAVTANGVTTNTDYIGGIQYVNNVIEFIQTEEGLARNNGGTYSYEYNLKDHLGNVRVTFTQNPVTKQIEVLQRDDYYPFGLRKEPAVKPGTNNYLYNGKELQEELSDASGAQYDYGARLYDPVIARWNGIDPLAYSYLGTSPYAYGVNNPVFFVDEDGRFINTSIFAVFGAIFGAAFEGAMSPHQFNSGGFWSDVGNGAIAGAVGGAVTGAIVDVTIATGGLGTAPAVAALSGAAGGLAGNVTHQLLTTGDVDWRGAAVATAAGGALGYAGGKIAGAAGKYIAQSETQLVTNLANVAVEIGSVSTNLGINAERSLAAEVGQITTKFYPANDGFLGTAERTFLMPGQQISRFGSNSGKFFSPTETPLTMRALPPGANTNIHNTFKVLKPFEVQAGKIAPAFGQLGLGTQYLSPVSADVLLKRGIIGY